MSETSRQADFISFVRRPVIGTVYTYVAKHNTRRNVDSRTFDEISKVFVPETKLHFILSSQLKRRQSAVLEGHVGPCQFERVFPTVVFNARNSIRLSTVYMYDIRIIRAYYSCQF